MAISVQLYGIQTLAPTVDNVFDLIYDNNVRPENNNEVRLLVDNSFQVTSGFTILNLPPTSGFLGIYTIQIFIIDIIGNAGFQGIQIVPSGTDTINGLYNIDLTTNYASLVLTVAAEGYWTVCGGTPYDKPTLQQVLNNGNSLLNGLNRQGDFTNGASGVNVNAFGNKAAFNNTHNNVNAFGNYSAYNNGNSDVNAIGNRAARSNTGQYLNAIGSFAGFQNTANNLNALGLRAGYQNSGVNVCAIGQLAARINSGNGLNALGLLSASLNTGSYCNAIGNKALYANVGTESTSIGSYSGRYNQGDYLMSIGRNSGESNTGDDVVSIGTNSGKGNTGNFVQAIGKNSVFENVGNHVIGLGFGAARENTGNDVAAFGKNAAISNAQSNRTIFSNDTMPTFANRAAAVAAITIPLGAAANNTYVYYNSSTYTMEAVRL